MCWGVGESLATIEKHSMPLEEATTPSLDALKAYSAGWNAALLSSFSAAVPHLKRAIAIDPQFVLAYGFLGLMYSNLGESDLAAESTRRAYELRDRASDRERFFIEWAYERQVTGNLKKGQQALAMWAQAYPRDPGPHGFYAGRVTECTGEFEKGVEEAAEAIRLGSEYAYASLAQHNVYLGRLAEAEKLCSSPRRTRSRSRSPTSLRYHIAFLKGDKAGMEREIKLAHGQPGVEDQMSHERALVLAHSGRMRDAAEMWQRAMASATETGDREQAALFEAGAAVCESNFGNAAAAKRRALAALDQARNKDVEFSAAYVLELSGDSTRARALADDLEKRFPEDTCVQFSYLPILRALSALAHHDPSGAVDRLQAALPYDLAATGTGFAAGFGNLYPAYVRGRAYLKAGRGPEAAAEFQKILDHRGVVVADPVDALARLQLGRAWALAGDKSKARAAYQDFLTLWKDADREIPILTEAKAEYARLQGATGTAVEAH
jgi:tetratricopeptide (TPR) repeat protein